MFMSIFFTSLLANLTMTDMSTFISVIMAYIRMFAILFVGTFSYEAHSSQPVESLYDFVVVGSGSAGAAVASRLSEVEGWNVLLLEAGGSTPPEAAVPGFNSFLLLEGTEANWGYVSEPQRYSLKNYKGKTIPIPRGRTVGGSSAVNFLMHVRGNRRDYDRWASLGNPGWDYDSVLPYFKKMENYRGVVTNETAQYRGFHGPLGVETRPHPTVVSKAFLKAGLELGYPITDPNAGKQIGFAALDVSSLDGVRQSSADAYLREPLLTRDNLHLLTEAHVVRVLFNKHKRAVGVRFVKDNKVQDVYVRKEVILCAGAVQTPQLLMLSGLGPRKHLNKLKIPLLVDLPGVGQNLQDHPTVFGLTWTVDRKNGNSFGQLINFKTSMYYRRTKKGPLSAPYGPEGISFMTFGFTPDPEWPDMQNILMGLTPGADSGLLIHNYVGFQHKFYRDYFEPLYGARGFNIGPMLSVPKSRGSITLQSNNPFDAPLIDPNFLSHPDDVRIFVKGIRFALEIGNSTAMRDIGAKFYDTPLPGCSTIPYASDEYWACFARHMVSTNYHPVGTCKMAPEGEKGGVVDHRLRVRGVSGLRVVDASIMPVIVAGNTNAAAIMIGEKGADLIKQDWRGSVVL